MDTTQPQIYIKTELGSLLIIVENKNHFIVRNVVQSSGDIIPLIINGIPHRFYFDVQCKEEPHSLEWKWRKSGSIVRIDKVKSGSEPTSKALGILSTLVEKTAQEFATHNQQDLRMGELWYLRKKIEQFEDQMKEIKKIIQELEKEKCKVLDEYMEEHEKQMK